MNYFEVRVRRAARLARNSASEWLTMALPQTPRLLRGLSGLSSTRAGALAMAAVICLVPNDRFEAVLDFIRDLQDGACVSILRV